MNYLVLCPCLHAVDNHDAYGCKGEHLRHCECRLAPGDALEAAIDAVRSSYCHERPGREETRREA